MAIDPETLIRQIDELWASLADHSQGEEQALMRACSLTLLVLVNEEDDVVALSETLAELMQSHPSRAILIRVAAGGLGFQDSRAHPEDTERQERQGHGHHHHVRVQVGEQEGPQRKLVDRVLDDS